MKNIDKQPTHKSILQVLACLVSVTLLSLCGWAVRAQITAPRENTAPGARPKSIPPGNPKGEPLVGIVPVITQTGNITLSVDGLGTLNSVGVIEVQKPIGATVRAAYLAAASTGFTGRVLVNGDVKINGSNVTFTQTVPSSITSSNSFGDVTAIVKPIVDASSDSIIPLTITEVNSASIDGEILAVVFDDPAQTTTNTVFILFGAQNIAGDTFNITTSAPINPAKPIDMSLGISHGFQSPPTAIQESIVNVNGLRMSSSAGGQDDADSVVVDNGALLTVGGIGDSNANPSPFATNGGNPRTDDELYDLRPFVTAGSTNITVFTQNPSNDDNIFFAALFFKDATGTIGGTCTLTCPANITTSTDLNQCGRVTTYPAPSTVGSCGTVSCSPASGAFFPKGTTTVTCTATGPPAQVCSFTVTVNDTQNPTITCPANQFANTSGGSVNVTYPSPVVSDNCPGVGASTCNPASGSSFPVGTTTVNCSVTDASGNVTPCAFTVTVGNQACTLTCPPNIISVGTQVCGASSGIVVNYPAPTTNCSGASIVCSPASGTTFPPGTTTVTCTLNGTTTCSFTVKVFNACVQDRSNPNSVLVWNTNTGEYIFCCNGSVFTGIGKVAVMGCTYTLDHNPVDRRVHGQVDFTTFRGEGFLQTPPGTARCSISDDDVRNNDCSCTGASPPSRPGSK